MTQYIAQLLDKQKALIDKIDANVSAYNSAISAGFPGYDIYRSVANRLFTQLDIIQSEIMRATEKEIGTFNEWKQDNDRRDKQ